MAMTYRDSDALSQAPMILFYTISSNCAYHRIPASFGVGACRVHATVTQRGNKRYRRLHRALQLQHTSGPILCGSDMCRGLSLVMVDAIMLCADHVKPQPASSSDDSDYIYEYVRDE